jgi:hypothetical protein
MTGNCSVVPPCLLASLAPEAVVIKHFSATAACAETAPNLFPDLVSPLAEAITVATRRTSPAC